MSKLWKPTFEVSRGFGRICSSLLNWCSVSSSHRLPPLSSRSHRSLRWYQKDLQSLVSSSLSSPSLSLILQLTSLFYFTAAFISRPHPTRKLQKITSSTTRSSFTWWIRKGNLSMLLEGVWEQGKSRVKWKGIWRSGRKGVRRVLGVIRDSEFMVGMVEERRVKCE